MTNGECTGDEWTFRISEKGVKMQWSAGSRDHITLAAAFTLGWVEPHVTWASDLGWRVTEAGKKAGLK